MDSQEFVSAIERYVRDAAIEDTIANLKTPPGRKPQIQAALASAWYNGLTSQEKDQVNGVVAVAVHAALFGLLAVVDGARTIDDENGRFELTYIAGGEKFTLNPQSINLHELLDSA